MQMRFGERYVLSMQQGLEPRFDMGAAGYNSLKLPYRQLGTWEHIQPGRYQFWSYQPPTADSFERCREKLNPFIYVKVVPKPLVKNKAGEPLGIFGVITSMDRSDHTPGNPADSPGRFVLLTGKDARNAVTIKIGKTRLPRHDPLFSNDPAYIKDLIFEPENIATALRFLPAGQRRCAVDVGAMAGESTHQLIKEGKFSKVHAFEPHPVNAVCFKSNLPAFNHSEFFRKVKLHEIALSNHEKPYWLMQHTSDPDTDEATAPKAIDAPVSDHYTNAGMVATQEKGAGNSPFRTRTLDSYKFKDVDLLKIDCEGTELEVLEGAKKTIYNYHPVILAEVNSVAKTFHGKRRNEARIRRLLASLGYHLRAIRVNEDLIFVPDTLRSQYQQVVKKSFELDNGFGPFCFVKQRSRPRRRDPLKVLPDLASIGSG